MLIERLHLSEHAALPWLHLLVPYKLGEYSERFHVSDIVCKHQRNAEGPRPSSGTAISSTPLSPTIKFRDPYGLQMFDDYSDTEGFIFHLTDDDVENLAAALSRLNYYSPYSLDNSIPSKLLLQNYCPVPLVAIHPLPTTQIPGDPLQYPNLRRRCATPARWKLWV